MIILAGTVILVISNSNLISKSREATNKANKANEYKQLELLVADALVESSNGKVDFDYLNTKIIGTTMSITTTTGTTRTYTGYQIYHVTDYGAISVEALPDDNNVVVVSGNDPIMNDDDINDNWAALLANPVPNAGSSGMTRYRYN